MGFSFQVIAQHCIIVQHGIPVQTRGSLLKHYCFSSSSGLGSKFNCDMLAFCSLFARETSRGNIPNSHCIVVGLAVCHLDSGTL